MAEHLFIPATDAPRIGSVSVGDMVLVRLSSLRLDLHDGHFVKRLDGRAMQTMDHDFALWAKVILIGRYAIDGGGPILIAFCDPKYDFKGHSADYGPLKQRFADEGVNYERALKPYAGSLWFIPLLSIVEVKKESPAPKRRTPRLQDLVDTEGDKQCEST